MRILNQRNDNYDYFYVKQADARAHADMEFLAREVASLRMAVGEVATRDFLRSELRSLLSELDERAESHAAEDEPERRTT